MILTRRFGALAARRVFPSVTSTEPAHDIDRKRHSAKGHRSDEQESDKQAA